MEGTGRVRGVRKIERVGAMVEAIERCRPVVSEIAGWTAVSRTRPDSEGAALETLDEERPSDGTAGRSAVAGRAVRTESSRTRPGEEGSAVESGCRVRPVKDRASADKVGSRLEEVERVNWLGGSRMRSDKEEGSVEIGGWSYW